MRRHRPRLGCRSRSLRVRTATPSAGPQQCRAGWRRRSQAPVSCRGRSRCQPRGGRRESVVAGGVGPAFLAARVERQQRLTSRGEYPIIAAEDCLVHRSGSFPTPPRTPVAGVERVHPICRPPTYTEPRWTTGDTQMTRRLHPAASAASVLRRRPVEGEHCASFARLGAGPA